MTKDEKRIWEVIKGLNLDYVADETGLRLPERRFAIDYGHVLATGALVELEHTRMPEVAAVIAAHHLDEKVNYYEIHERAGL
jgi:hypothetical protein